MLPCIACPLVRASRWAVVMTQPQPQSALICTLAKAVVHNHDDARSLVDEAMEGKEHLILFKAGGRLMLQV